MGAPIATDSELNALLDRLARPHAVDQVAVGAGVLDRAAARLAAALPAGEWLIVGDGATWEAAGSRVCDDLQSLGIGAAPHVVPPRPGHLICLAGNSEVAGLVDALADCGASAAVAVGAGTINDIAKLASFRAGIPYAVLPTAPSMNGYTSGIAAILSEGVKTTAPCHLPLACLADTEVLTRAPLRMLAAGYGDLLSRPVSCADWYLSHRLRGTDYPREALELIAVSEDLVRGVAAGLPARDPAAVTHLTAALLVSGLAMGAASSSAPASGGEHLISHYLDMTHYSHGEPRDLHGCQVGVASLVTAALWERFLSLDPDRIDVSGRVAYQPSWRETEDMVRQSFGALAPAVLPHARDSQPAPGELELRLRSMVDQWDDLTVELRAILRPAADIRRDLEMAGCPVTFRELGISPERARRAALLSRHVRGRYTILDLCAELGVLEPWLESALAGAGDPA